MARRMGKRERLAKRSMHNAWKGYVEAVVANNLSQAKPEAPSLSRDETASLKGNSHTRGFSLGQRRTRFQKPGSY